MLRLLSALVAIVLLAGSIWTAEASAYADIPSEPDGIIVSLQTASDLGEALPSEPDSSIGEHCFHKLAGILRLLTAPARIETEVRWSDVSEALRQTYLPPSHPPPVLTE